MTVTRSEPRPQPTAEPATDRRVVLRAFGGPEGLEVVDDALPEPGPGEVRAKILAASAQFTDVIIRRGEYPDLKEKPPLTPGYDFVGVVDAVGPGVTEVKVGDRVADLTMIGSYARYRISRAANLVAVPEGLDPAEAVSLVLSWMTAYQLLHRHAKVKRGQEVLVHGAAGAVGQALLRLGQMHGLKMYGTARGEHADLVASLGATPIDYRTEDFTEVLKDGVDVVFDGIAEEGFARSWKVVRKGGFLSAYGFSKPIADEEPLLKVGYWFARLYFWKYFPNGKGAGFYSITSVRAKHPDWFREDLTQLFEWLRAGEIAPRVAERIRLDDVADAHRRIEAGGLDGKLIIDPWLT